MLPDEGSLSIYQDGWANFTGNAIIRKIYEYEYNINLCSQRESYEFKWQTQQ